ncbi:molybdopterin molybdotransferase MoeA [Microbacterium sp. bgisy189]|uniref:molybdopterin molybdotransferase MoeA n=1 Tax=Microbacterium sp. bgisy189 TaxID=3413798 RepID=UPI003EBB09EB
MMGDLRTVEAHLGAVLDAVRPTDRSTTTLPQAFGRTLATAVTAAVDVPVFDNSAMDGFAVRFADVASATPDSPVTLRVVADLPAGTQHDPPLGPGQAARIMTGSPVPTDADAIVPFEHTAGGLEDSLETVVVLRAPAAEGAHVRRRGEDLHTGDEVLPAGIRLGAWQLGAIAAAGVGTVTVSAPPQVLVVSTGSELVAPGTALHRGQIPESNSTLIAGLVAEAGGHVVHVASVDDEGSGLRGLLREYTGERLDAVVFTGGVSAGAYEVVKNELADAMTFSKVAMQPGKPQGFGVTSEGTLLFGLPGNPVSAAVSFEVFVRPALLAMQGRGDLARPVLRLPASTSWRTPPGRRQYLPAAINRTDPAHWTVGPATRGGSGSHLAGGLGRAEAYAVVPAETEAVTAGDLIDVLLLEG